MPRLREEIRGAVPLRVRRGYGGQVQQRRQGARVPEMPQPPDGAPVLRLRHERRFGREVHDLFRRFLRRMPALELRRVRALRIEERRTRNE